MNGRMRLSGVALGCVCGGAEAGPTRERGRSTSLSDPSWSRFVFRLSFFFFFFAVIIFAPFFSSMQATEQRFSEEKRQCRVARVCTGKR